MHANGGATEIQRTAGWCWPAKLPVGYPNEERPATVRCWLGQPDRINFVIAQLSVEFGRLKRAAVLIENGRFDKRASGAIRRPISPADKGALAR